MYVLDYHQQVKRINQMIPLRKNDKTFEVYYHDPQSGELWKSFFPYGKKNSLSPEKWEYLLNLLNDNRKNYTRAGFFTFLNKLGVKEPDKTIEALHIDFNNASVSREKLMTLRKKAKKLWFKKLIGL